MHEYRCKIKKVVDGDTVYLDQRVRLYGIDTPESRTRDKVEKIYGKAAGRYLKAMLGKECPMRTPKDANGKFGRILGEFVVYDADCDAWRSVNQLMIENHLAVAYHGQSKDDIEEEHLKNRELLEPTFL